MAGEMRDIKTTANASGTQRRRGRPKKSDSPNLPEISREAIIEFAFSMTVTESLDTLSMVKVATAMAVSPSSVHYYLSKRDALISGVINRFYREVCESTPEASGSAREAIKAIVQATYQVMLKYPGIVRYLSSHNRFRLVQEVQEGEIDYGIKAFDLLGVAIMRAGYSGRDTAMLGHLLRMFILSSAQAEAQLQTPSFHKQFLDGILGRFKRKSYPGLHHSLRDFASLDGAEVFNTGLEILLDGFERRTERNANVNAAKA